MSQENVEIIRAVYDPYREGNFRVSAGLPDPHAVLVLVGAGDRGLETPESGPYVGREAIAAYTRELVRPWTGFTMEAEESSRRETACS